MANDGARMPLKSVLRMGRLRLALTLEQASEDATIYADRIRAIEDGFVAPTEAELERLAEAYGLDPARLGAGLWVPRSAPRLDADDGVLWIEWLPISLGEEPRRDLDLLTRVADGIRFMRSVGSLAPVHMRAEEMELVVSVLTGDTESIIADWVQAFRVPWTTANDQVIDAQRRIRLGEAEQTVERLTALRR